MFDIQTEKFIDVLGSVSYTHLRYGTERNHQRRYANVRTSFLYRERTVRQHESLRNHRSDKYETENAGYAGCGYQEITLHLHPEISATERNDGQDVYKRQPLPLSKLFSLQQAR